MGDCSFHKLGENWDLEVVEEEDYSLTDVPNLLRIARRERRSRRAIGENEEDEKAKMEEEADEEKGNRPSQSKKDDTGADEYEKESRAYPDQTVRK